MFKKKTKEQQMQLRANEILTQLLKHYEEGFKTKEFTELETVQILNTVKRMAYEYLSQKKADCLDESTKQKQKADEINAAMELFS